MKVVNCRNEILKVHRHFDTNNCGNSLSYSVLSARNGALRQLLVFKRKQEGSKDINRSLPMDSTSSDLSLFRKIERQGFSFYDEWKEFIPTVL